MQKRVNRTPHALRNKIIQNSRLEPDTARRLLSLTDAAERALDDYNRNLRQIEDALAYWDQKRGTVERLQEAARMAEIFDPVTVARLYDVEETTLHHWRAREVRQTRAQMKEQAEIFIMRLYRQGLGNREIARRVQKPGGGRYHPGSVSRIIKRRKAATG